MNKKIAARLLGLMEVKTQVEKSGYAVLAQQQQAAFDEAAVLKRSAGEAALATADAHASTSLKQAAAYSARLYADARRKHRDGQTLEIKKQQQRAHVHTALQREIAAEHLLTAAEIRDRKRRENAEEASRELTRAQPAATGRISGRASGS